MSSLLISCRKEKKYPEISFLHILSYSSSQVCMDQSFCQCPAVSNKLAKNTEFVYKIKAQEKF